MKSLKIALLCLALVPCFVQSSDETDKLVQSSFRINTIHDRGPFYLACKGTAFGIDLSDYGFKGKKFVLTAAHNVAIKIGVVPKTTIEIKENEWVKCSIMKIDEDLDLAIMEVEKEIPVLKLAKEDVKVGKEITMASSPNGEAIKLFNGKVVKRWEGGTIFTKAEIELEHGDSGSAVICSNGKVVGVIVAGLKKGDKIDNSIGLFIPISVILTFLEEKRP